MDGTLRAKHLLPVLERVDPESPIVIGIHVGMPNAMCNDGVILDKACTVVQINTSDRGTTISLSNAVSIVHLASEIADSGGELVYPPEPQIQTFDIDTSGSRDEMERQISDALQTPTQPIAAA